MIDLKDKLIVKGGDYREILNSVLPDSFQVTQTVNQSWQIQFNAYDDKSVAFSLLEAQNSLLWRGQEFVIKQCQPTYSNSLNTTQVTATHIGYDVSRIFQHKTNSGTKTYSVNDVLTFYLNGNSFGYTWEVIGSFGTDQIENLGNGSGQDMLSKITSTWSNAIITFDNKKIKVYNADNFYVDSSKVITYLGNSNNVQLTYDSTSLVNKLYCTSDGSGDDSTPSFNPFYVTDDDSIQKYGVYEGSPVSDNRFTDATAMRKYAESQLQPNPSLSIQVSFNGGIEDINIGEIRTLIIPELDLRTKVKVTQITDYPLSNTQQNQAQLDSTAKTILNFNQALQSYTKTQITNSNGTNTSIVNAIQNNQSEIDKINTSLQQTSQIVSNDFGSITFTKQNNVVYVNCKFTNIVSGTSKWNIPNGYAPANAVKSSLVVILDTNYIVNYSINNNEFSIDSITNLKSDEVVELLQTCTASFSYLI